MSEEIAIFQLGPVQEFISCARRTQDFWSGSYLLSYLNCVAMNHVVQSSGGNLRTIIYPALKNQPLFCYVQRLTQKGKLPWEYSPADDAELSPTVPNRFVAIIDHSAARTILNGSAEKVHQAFTGMAERIALELEEELRKNKVTELPDRTIWTRQTAKFFETYWVLHPYDPQDTPYQVSHHAAEALFSARKAIRDFPPGQPEPGYKCTLCGQREPLCHTSGDSRNRGRLRAFWTEIRQATGNQFADGEHLCAVCTTKRLAPKYVFGRENYFPSTSTVAVSDFVSHVADTCLPSPSGVEMGSGLLGPLQQFLDRLRPLAKKAREPLLVEPMPKTRALVRRHGAAAPAILGDFVRIEGDWFFEETYKDLETQAQQEQIKIDEKTLNDARQALNALFEGLKQTTPPHQISLRPAKYLALIRLDGDRMGEHISNCQSKEDHHDLSQAMCDFSLGTVARTIEIEHLGKAVYFGGDEGIAFVSLQHSLKMIEQCHKDFEASFSHWQATVSLGGVIAHHQHNLIQVLREAQSALEKAKDLQGKDGFCIAVIKRSGGTSYARAKWRYHGLDTLTYLMGLVNHYAEANLSDRWWHQLDREELAFKEIEDQRVSMDTGPLKLEVARLLPRHVKHEQLPSDDSDGIDALVRDTCSLLDGMDDAGQPWEDFTALMGLASYIARGGGR